MGASELGETLSGPAWKRRSRPVLTAALAIPKVVLQLRLKSTFSRQCEREACDGSVQWVAVEINWRRGSFDYHVVIIKLWAVYR